MTLVPPGSTIGIVGGGQLGRMLSVAAAQLGYRCHIYDPEEGPAAEVAARWTGGAYDDVDALAAFARDVDVVTFEFENVPAEAMEAIAATTPVFPPPRALKVSQDRLDEKQFAKANGVATAPYAPVATREALDIALGLIGTPAILKTRRFGYDGKGQARLAHPDDTEQAWDGIGRRPAILEGQVAFAHEYSVILARGQDGAIVHWGAPENVHRDGILHSSTVPAPDAVQAQLPDALAMAGRIADALDYVGVLACEFFATGAGPVFNEMAPRVHNSGHWTIEGAVTSQFENHIRAICGLPLGSTALAGERVTMTNLIGGDADGWLDILGDERAHLHLYGKDEARPGRKMGHVTRLG